VSELQEELDDAMTQQPPPRPEEAARDSDEKAIGKA